MKAPTWLLLGLAVLSSQAVTGDEGKPMFKFVEGSAGAASLRIDMDRISNYSVPLEYFGVFTEVLAHCTYNGFWADVLSNPSLEPMASSRILRNYEKGERGWIEGVLGREIAAFEETDIGFQWFAWNGTDENYSLVGDAYNTDFAQKIEVVSSPVEPKLVGIVQPVFLPVKREKNYAFSLHMRDTDVPLVVTVVNPVDGSQVFARAVIPPSHKSTWTKRSVQLKLDIGDEWQGRAVAVCIGFEGGGQAVIDQLQMLPDDHEDGFDSVVLELLRDWNVSVLRFPGGNYVSGYHWKDALTPPDKRPTKPNPAWAHYTDSNQVGTDEHMVLCRKIGAEPLICVNAGNGTPQEAADWVEYCNGSVATKWGRVRAERGHAESYGIKYWEIGNELYGGWQIGHCGPEEYARRYRAFHDAMKAVDPSIHLIACGETGALFPDWNAILVKECGDILDTISLHLLFGAERGATAEQDFLSKMGNSYLYEGLFKRVVGLGSSFDVALTEYEIFTGGRKMPTCDTISEALHYTGIFNSAMRTEGAVNLTTYSALVNFGGGVRKLWGHTWVVPAYHARKELCRLVGYKPIGFEVTTPFADLPHWPDTWAWETPERFPLIDAMPLRRNGKLSVILANRDPKNAMPVRISLEGARLSPQAAVFALEED